MQKQDEKVYHISEPDFHYIIIRDKYAILVHPLYSDIKIFNEMKKNIEWFNTKEECLVARKKLTQEDLENEKKSKKNRVKN